MTEQRAFQNIVKILLYKAINVSQKPSCVCYLIPKTIAHLFTLNIEHFTCFISVLKM